MYGTGFNADVWDKVLQPLAQTHRTIAYDRRAYYRTRGDPPPRQRYNEQHAEDLVALLRALEATPATILAWSAGAFYALHSALKYPDVVRHLVLYEPPLYAIRNISFPVLITFAKIFFLKAVGKPQAAAKTFARMVLAYSDGRNSYESLPPELRAGLARDSRTLLAELAAGTGEELNPEILQTLNAPVTLLFGELSHLSLRQAMDQLACIFPLAPLVRLPGANDLAQVDRPQAFVRAVSGVLASD